MSVGSDEVKVRHLPPGVFGDQLPPREETPMATKPKRKRTTCSLCNEEGHNARGCPGKAAKATRAPKAKPALMKAPPNAADLDQLADQMETDAAALRRAAEIMRKREAR